MLLFVGLKGLAFCELSSSINNFKSRTTFNENILIKIANRSPTLLKKITELENVRFIKVNELKLIQIELFPFFSF